jgi:hypothetical protein
VTSYFVGLMPFGFFLTTYTLQRQINVPLTKAFAGFNGLTITGANGVALPKALVFNPGQTLASQDCSENGQNRELVFQSQSGRRDQSSRNSARARALLHSLQCAVSPVQRWSDA